MKRQEHNSGRHIDDIISRTICNRHHGDKGVACFYIYYSSRDGEAEAVCNNRVKAAGFNGKINPSSLRQKTRDGNKYSRA